MKNLSIFALLVLVFTMSLMAAHDEPPKVLQVKRTVGQVESSGTAITLYTRLFGLDTPEGVNEQYNRFRLYDSDVVATADKSPIPKRAQEFTKTQNYYKMYGKEVTLTGEYFLITGPTYTTTLEEGKQKRTSNLERLQFLLDTAESNYVASTEKLLISEFMDWSDNPARIYVIPNQPMWLRLRDPQSAEYIAANYCVNDLSREFALLDTPSCAEFVPHVLCYAIDEQILKEYGRVLSGRPDSKLPLFVMTGVSGELSGLEAAIVPPAFVPVQVREVVINNKVKKIKRPKLDILLPLQVKRLIPFAELKESQTLPQAPEQKYYFLRESRGVIEKLWKESPLGMLSLIRALSIGRNFDKEFSLSYCEMQRGIIGTEVKEQKQNSTNIVQVGSADLKALEKASNRLFYEMTQEKMTEDILKAKKAKEEEAKKAAQEGGASQETEPAEGEAAPSEEEAKPAENEAAPSEETKPAEESKPADAEPEIDTESSNSTK